MTSIMKFHIAKSIQMQMTSLLSHLYLPLSYRQCTSTGNFWTWYQRETYIITVDNLDTSTDGYTVMLSNIHILYMCVQCTCLILLSLKHLQCRGVSITHFENDVVLTSVTQIVLHTAALISKLHTHLVLFCWFVMLDMLLN